MAHGREGGPRDRAPPRATAERDRVLCPSQTTVPACRRRKDGLFESGRDAARSLAGGSAVVEGGSRPRRGAPRGYSEEDAARSPAIGRVRSGGAGRRGARAPRARASARLDRAGARRAAAALEEARASVEIALAGSRGARPPAERNRARWLWLCVGNSRRRRGMPTLQGLSFFWGLSRVAGRASAGHAPRCRRSPAPDARRRGRARRGGALVFVVLVVRRRRGPARDGRPAPDRGLRGAARTAAAPERLVYEGRAAAARPAPARRARRGPGGGPDCAAFLEMHEERVSGNTSSEDFVRVS